MTILDKFRSDLESSVDDVEKAKDNILDAFSDVENEFGRIEYALERMSNEDIHLMYKTAYSSPDRENIERAFERIDSQLEMAGKDPYWEGLDGDEREEVVQKILPTPWYKRREFLGGALGGALGGGMMVGAIATSGDGNQDTNRNDSPGSAPSGDTTHTPEATSTLSPASTPTKLERLPPSYNEGLPETCDGVTKEQVINDIAGQGYTDMDQYFPDGHIDTDEVAFRVDEDGLQVAAFDYDDRDWDNILDYGKQGCE